jgi:5'-nucleotidase / UDP-sugar diphosphatase
MKNRKQFLILNILLVFTLLTTAFIAPAAAVAQDAEEPFPLTIMHTNDVHSHYDPNREGNGGITRMATIVKQIRAEVDNALLVDAGDQFTGTLYHVQHRGKDTSQLMNFVGYDAMALGNHEFDDGEETLAAFLNATKFPVLSANIDDSGSAVLADMIEPYAILDVGEEKVGVIGLITPETDILSSPSKETLFDSDLVAVAQASVDALTAEGVNKIILLSHCGYQADLEIAQATSGIDVIVGGHTHTFLSNMFSGGEDYYPVIMAGADGDAVLVVSSGEHLEFLGRLNVEFDADGLLTDWDGDVILISQYIAAEPTTNVMLKFLARPIEELTAKEIGESGVYLEGDRSVCRFEECNLGSLIADAIREETGVQVALQNGGGIRASIEQGTVTLGDVMTVLPFGNLISTFELAGSDLIEVLENGVSRVDVDEGTGRFLQVSGLRYTFDASRPVGSRVSNVEVWNAETETYEALVLSATYTMGANDYMRSGGDGYSVLADNAINPYDFGSPLDQVVADYIATNSPVEVATDGRINVVE